LPFFSNLKSEERDKLIEYMKYPTLSKIKIGNAKFYTYYIYVQNNEDEIYAKYTA